MDRVITYNFTDDFIKKLASFIEKNYKNRDNDLSRLALVFGGKRPALFLKKELAARFKKSFFPPVFFSMDEFVSYMVSKKGFFSKIKEMDSCFLLYNIAREILPDMLKAKETFSRFLPWAREILAFIEQLDLEDIPIEALKNIQLSADIGYEVPENVNILLENIILLKDGFDVILKKNRSYSRGLLYRLAAQETEEDNLEEFEKIFFCNLFYLHKTEEKIIKSLYDKEKALLFLQKDNRAWSVLEKIAKNFSCKIEPEGNSRPNYNLNIYAGFDTHSQVCIAREVLKKINDMDKTLIVLPDPDTFVPLLSEITRVVGDFNVSIGYPLKRSSLYSVFELIFEAQNTRKEDKYYTKDYLKALSHPLIKNLAFSVNDAAITRVLVHKLEEIVTGIEESVIAGSLFIKLTDIENLKDVYEITSDTLLKMGIEITTQELKKTFRELHQLLFYSWEKIADFSAFSTSLDGFLETLVEKSFMGNYPLNLLIADKIFYINSELKTAAFNKESFAKEEIFRIFMDNLDNQRISFSGSPLKGLQVLGLFETRALNFENVIILDANEKVLPSLNIYEPLIPREVMVGLGLNRLEKEDEIQRYQFMRLLGGSKNVHLIYDAATEKEKSRFLEELIWGRQKEKESLFAITIPKAAFTIKIQPAKQEINKTKEMFEFLQKKTYSASSLNTYLNCPLRFYYQYVLGLEEKEDLLEEPEARDIGTFIHELLEEAFKPFKGRRPVIDGTFRAYFNQMLEQKFQQTFAQKMKSDSFLLKEIVMLRMKNFLQKEEQRDIEKIVSLEEEDSSDINLNCGKFKFKYRIDRIDKMSDGSLLIIDYKTGSTDLKPSSFDKIESKGFTRQIMKKTIKSFQLPLYYYFVGEKHSDCVINAAFYNLKNSTLTTFLKNEDLSAKDRINAVFTKGLNAIFQELLDVNLRFTADEENVNYCAGCPFFYLCR
jgi:hypothetical protein